MKEILNNIKFTLIDKIILIIIVIFLITYLMIRLFAIKSETVLLNYANNKSMQLSTELINSSLYEILYDREYDTFMNTKIGNNDMLDISLNNKRVNELLFLVNNNLIKNISKLENDNSLIFNVPIGVIYDIPILVGIGPKIPFKLDIIANTDNTVYTNIRDYGINNSIIEVILNINLNIQIILPFTSKEVQIKKEIPIDTKIIEGKVPTYYGGIRSNN